MRGYNEQLVLNVAETITFREPYTRMRICNQTGAALYGFIGATGTPSATDAHFVIQNNGEWSPEFDNASQAPSQLRLRTGNTGYVHITTW